MCLSHVHTSHTVLQSNDVKDNLMHEYIPKLLIYSSIPQTLFSTKNNYLTAAFPQKSSFPEIVAFMHKELGNKQLKGFDQVNS